MVRAIGKALHGSEVELFLLSEAQHRLLLVRKV